MNEFVISNFVKIFRKYSSKYSSNVDCLNDLFYIISEPLKLKNKNNKEYSISKGDVSDIMNRKEEVPSLIRNGVYQLGINKIKDGFDYFLNGFDEIDFDSISKALKKLYSNKDDNEYNPLLEDKFNKCINDPSEFLANTFSQCLLNKNKLIYDQVIYSKGNKKTSLIVGNLLSIAFDTKYKDKEKIIVIPVDAYFTMKVDG